MDSESCLLTIDAYHNAGCGAIKASGFVQYLNSKPWLIAIIAIVVGIGACFFGGHLYDIFAYVVPALFSFLFVAVMLSSFGLFSVLEADQETSGMGVFKAILGTLVALAVAIGVGVLAKLMAKITSGLVGAVGGFLIGFLIYSLVFAQFIRASTVLLWITVILTSAGGAFCMY